MVEGLCWVPWEQIMHLLSTVAAVTELGAQVTCMLLVSS
jgi:hypothetical protein